MAQRLHVDLIACDGRGFCAELLPELVSLDEWGYPMIVADAVPVQLDDEVRRAVAMCPTFALRLRDAQT